MRKPSGCWLKMADTGAQIQRIRLANRTLQETFLIKVVPFNSDLLLSTRLSQLSEKSPTPHIEIFKTNSLEELQSSLFTGCIGLNYSCSSSGVSETKAHGRTKKKIKKKKIIKN